MYICPSVRQSQNPPNQAYQPLCLSIVRSDDLFDLLDLLEITYAYGFPCSFLNNALQSEVNSSILRTPSLKKIGKIMGKSFSENKIPILVKSSEAIFHVVVCCPMVMFFR